MPGHKKTIAELMGDRKGPPLDYSFKDFKLVTEMIDEEPWSGTRKPIAASSANTDERKEEGEGADDGGKGKADSAQISSTGQGVIKSHAMSVGVGNDTSIHGGQIKAGQALGGAGWSSGEGKSGPTLGTLKTEGIRLANNEIEHLNGLEESLAAVLEEPKDMTWLDLSFNMLTKIDDVLCAYPNLYTLQMHSNQISDFREIKKLEVLPRLRKLTLHGNPVEEKKNYRYFVISTLPNLKELDFCPITKLDREKAKTWRAIYKARKRR